MAEPFRACEGQTSPLPLSVVSDNPPPAPRCVGGRTGPDLRLAGPTPGPAGVVVPYELAARLAETLVGVQVPPIKSPVLHDDTSRSAASAMAPPGEKRDPWAGIGRSVVRLRRWLHDTVDMVIDG